MGFGKLFKRLGSAALGGGMGFLTGGPAGAAIGAAGGFFGVKGKGGRNEFMQGREAGTTGVTDVRSPAERALGEAQAKYYMGKMGEKDLGFQAEMTAEDPYWKQEEDILSQRVAGAAAERGFGALRHGPSVTAMAQGLGGMAAERAKFNVGARRQWQQDILSGGRATAAGPGRSAYAMDTPAQPSGLAQLMGPAIGALGKETAPDIMGRVGRMTSGFKDLFKRRGAPTAYPTGSPFGGARYT